MMTRQLHRSIRINDMTWLKWIFFGWLLIVSAANVDKALPASYWLEVTNVHVSDAIEGQPRNMVVSRIIKRPFRAKWIAEVERWDGSQFEIVQNCTGRGENAYSPENRLPKNLTLAWWVYPTVCVLPAGQYRVETVWTLENGKEVRAVSNVFTIKGN